MKKLLNFMLVVAMVVMFGGVSFADDFLGSSEADFMWSSLVSLNVTLHAVSNDDATDAISWNVPEIFNDIMDGKQNDKWYDSTTYAKIQTKLVGTARVYILQDNRDNPEANPNDYYADSGSPRTQTICGKSGSVYSGLVIGTSHGGANGYIPLIYKTTITKIDKSETPKIFPATGTAPESMGQTKYFLDAGDNSFTGNTMINYMLVANKDGFGYSAGTTQ